MTKLPNFIYAGAPKAGSTWLFHILKNNPDIFLPEGKELQFFDQNYHLGQSWYIKQFTKSSPKQITGDISPEYFNCNESALRIKSLNPDVRLIFCLREPIDAMTSWYYQLLSIGRMGSTSLNEYLLKEDSFNKFEYDRLLEPFIRLFKREQILILFYDELCASPNTFIKKIEKHIGLSHTQTSDDLNKVIWKSRLPRSRLLNYIAYNIGKALRKLGLAKLVGWISLHPLFIRVIYSEATKARASELVLSKIRPKVDISIKKLSKTNGLNIPSSWIS